MDGTCKNCRFWELTGPKEGECHRRAPAVVVGMLDRAAGEAESDAVWPVTPVDAWCGDHEPAGDKPKPKPRK